MIDWYVCGSLSRLAATHDAAADRRCSVPVRRDETGRLVVHTGQKRVLAAIEASLDQVRVIVETPLAGEPDRRIDRILDQLGENEHRSGISDADEVRATQQLLGLGLTAGQIARRRHIPPNGSRPPRRSRTTRSRWTPSPRACSI